jgi:hypothetical protein
MRTDELVSSLRFDGFPAGQRKELCMERLWLGLRIAGRTLLLLAALYLGQSIGITADYSQLDSGFIGASLAASDDTLCRQVEPMSLIHLLAWELGLLGYLLLALACNRFSPTI